MGRILLLLVLLSAISPGVADAEVALPPLGLEVAFDDGSLQRVEHIDGQSVLVRVVRADGSWFQQLRLAGLLNQETLFPQGGDAVRLTVNFDPAQLLRLLPPQVGDELELPYTTLQDGKLYGHGVSSIRFEEAEPLAVGSLAYPVVLVVKETTIDYADGASERFRSREWYATELGLVLRSEVVHTTAAGRTISRSESRAIAVTYP